MNKKLLLVSISLFLTVSFCTQAQQLTFSKVLYNFQQGGVQSSAVAAAFDNGYIIVGEAESQKGLIVKIDSSGSVVWSEMFDNNNPAVDPDVVFTNVIATNDSCYVIVGSSYNSATQKPDGLCIKINADGDTLWSKRFNNNGYSTIAISVVQTNDSGYAISGNTWSSSQSVFAAKLDAGGNLQWMNILTGGNNNNTCSSLKQTPDSGYIVAGDWEDYPPYDPNAFLMKLSSSGTFLWAMRYHFTDGSFCSGNDVAITNDGFLMYVNVASGIGLIKVDSSGTIVWSKKYNQTSGSNFSPYGQNPKLHKTADGGYVFESGSCFGSGLNKVDSSGDMTWSKNVFIAAGDVVQSKDSGFLIVGSGPLCGVRLSGFPSPQIGIIKTDSIGFNRTCISDYGATMTLDNEVGLPAVFTSVTGGVDSSIHPNISVITLLSDSGCVDFGGGVKETKPGNDAAIYPNPSSGIFNFVTNEPQSDIIIYNSLGDIVYQSQNNGKTFKIDLTACSTGIYLYRILSADNSTIGKLIKTD